MKNRNNDEAKRRLIVKAVRKGELDYLPADLKPDDLNVIELAGIVEDLEAWTDKRTMEYTEEEARLILGEKYRQGSKRTRRFAYTYSSFAIAASLAVFFVIFLPRDAKLKHEIAQLKTQTADTTTEYVTRVDTVLLKDPWTPDLVGLDPGDYYIDQAVTMGSDTWDMITWPQLFITVGDTFKFRIVSLLNCRVILMDADFRTLIDEVKTPDDRYVTITYKGLKAGLYFYRVSQISPDQTEELIIQNSLYVVK